MHRRRQQGISLVEVLVTLVSTSVGLLGIAALQLVSVRSNQESLIRLRATSLASSMVEQLRAQPSDLRAEFESVPFDGSGTPEATVALDVQAWQQEIDRTLPGGAAVAAGAIERRDDSRIFVVSVRWRSHGTDSTPQRSENSVRLQVEL